MINQESLEQVIRPTGLIDPEIIMDPCPVMLNPPYGGQVQDFIHETEQVVHGGGVSETTLTKKILAEDYQSFSKVVKKAEAHSLRRRLLSAYYLDAISKRRV